MKNPIYAKAVSEPYFFGEKSRWIRAAGAEKYAEQMFRKTFFLENMPKKAVLLAMAANHAEIYMHKDTEWSIGAMRIKTPNKNTKIRSLSGGNQQKVILGRWLLTEPEVLLLDEPTRGIDVGAKYEIYQLILELAEKGKSVIMVSSEMPELMGVCDI